MVNFSYVVLYSYFKLLVFDGEEVVVGGYNISILYLLLEVGGKGLCDFGLVVCGFIVCNVVVVFYDIW